jgi:hypothetical protein
MHCDIRSYQQLLWEKSYCHRKALLFLNLWHFRRYEEDRIAAMNYCIMWGETLSHMQEKGMLVEPTDIAIDSYSIDCLLQYWREEQ